MSLLTVLTPCHPSHLTTLERAVTSVEAQTISVEHRVMIDEESRGAGYIRNRLLERVTTPYVAFLDADDWLEPDFAERCLQAMPERGYVFPDWYEGDKMRQAPFRPWCGGTWHIITAVLRTDDARRVGGFSETLSAMEDTEFYMKLSTAFICGTRVQKPLVHYDFNPAGRSQTARKSGAEQTIKRQLLERYGHMAGCCGEVPPNMTPEGDKAEGDLYAMALWGGNRTTVGVVSQRVYPRMSYPMTTWVDPRDIEHDLRLPEVRRKWRVVEVPTLSHLPPVTDDNGKVLTGLDALTKTMQKSGVIKDVAVIEPGQYTPDFQFVIETAKRRLA